MLTLLMRRVVRLVVVLAGVSLVTFAILQVSGDPVRADDAGGARGRPGGRSARAMGFNDPLPVQFVRFLGNIARGDFGQSFFHREPALPLVLEPACRPRCSSPLLAMALSPRPSRCPSASCSAVRRNSLFDHAATLVVFLGTSMPVFWTGIMLILLFAVQLARPARLGLGELGGARPARGHAGHLLDAAAPAHRPLEHAGGDQPRLRAHGAGQGRLRVVRHLPPRPHQRRAPAGHGGRAPVRAAARRRRRDRDRLRGARAWAGSSWAPSASSTSPSSRPASSCSR